MTEANVLFSYGYGGARWSGGLDLLRHRVAKLNNVDFTKVVEYTSMSSVERLLKVFRDPTILVGHSYGVAAMIGAARKSGVKVPLIISIDPSPWISLFIPASWSIRSFGGYSKPSNVKRIHNFHTNDFPGGVQIDGAENELVLVDHLLVDDADEVHDKSVALIEQAIRELQ